ncbi:exported hypothetical protein [metagenome]|uniref:Uncharacterized protein n=1 Tax=metagenome TaxID=256318 RepID=A0A2P2C6A4_9ZZZZ
MAELTPSRRTLVRGAAWSVPVVAVAATAPAYAASNCAGQPAHTMNLAKKTGSDGTTLSVTSVATGVTVGPHNLSTSDPAFPLSGWLELENVPRATAATNPTRYQDVTFTFGQSVSLLEFTLSDLDSTQTWTQSYWDRVAIINSASGFQATPVVPGNTAVTGAGTLNDPLRQTTFTSSTPALNNDTSRQMKVAFTGTTQSITIRFWSSRDTFQSGTHAVWIGNMTYKTNCSV